MGKEFSANVPSWRYQIEDLPGRRDENFYSGRFSSNMYPVKDDTLKNGCDKKESRELKCAI
jgi:hypothetical protein